MTTDEFPDLMTAGEIKRVLRITTPTLRRITVEVATAEPGTEPPRGYIRGFRLGIKGDFRYHAGDVRRLVLGEAQPGGGGDPSTAESVQPAGLCTQSNQEA
jgi:hypothetical protein